MTTEMKSRWMHEVAAAALSLATILLTGCGGFIATAPVVVAPIQGSAITGSVHGGQQPIWGATMAVYAAGSSGYHGTNTNLLTKTVLTDGGGNFSVTGDYACTPGQQMYLVATGGNPGDGPNANIALMAALGDCANIPNIHFVNLNEITTIGSVFALAPFMSSITSVSTSPTNSSGLAHAFASVNKLINIGTGSSPGPALPAGASAPTKEILELANIIAACINSAGAAAGPDSACAQLFSLTTPPNGAVPTDTIQAALNIAQHPTLNASALYYLQGAQSPFPTQVATPPNDWTLAVTYSMGGFSAPKSTTVDAAGNIWVANSGANSVTVLAHTGSALAGSPFTGNGLSAPDAVAIDTSGNGWIANGGGATVSAFTASGSALSGSPFTGAATISAPRGIAIDAPGNIWVANGGNNSVTELNASGAYLQQVSRGVSSPGSVVVNPK